MSALRWLLRPQLSTLDCGVLGLAIGLALRGDWIVGALVWLAGTIVSFVGQKAIGEAPF